MKHKKTIASVGFFFLCLGGLQQPCEISVISGVNETAINLELAVYLNPTSDFLQLNVESQEFEYLSFYLSDMQWKLVKSNRL